jgi:hypothetical protein
MACYLAKWLQITCKFSKVIMSVTWKMYK